MPELSFCRSAKRSLNRNNYQSTIFNKSILNSNKPIENLKENFTCRTSKNLLHSIQEFEEIKEYLTLTPNKNSKIKEYDEMAPEQIDKFIKEGAYLCDSFVCRSFSFSLVDKFNYSWTTLFGLKRDQLYSIDQNSK